MSSAPSDSRLQPGAASPIESIILIFRILGLD
jgi:hypothetical protein